MDTRTESQDIFDLDVRDVVTPASDEELRFGPSITCSQQCTGNCCTIFTC